MRCTKVHIVSRFKFKYKFEFYLRPATRTREDREKCGLSCTVRKQFVHTSNPGVSQPANRLEAMSGRGQGGRRGGAAPDRGRDEDAVSDASGSARARRGEMPQVR